MAPPLSSPTINPITGFSEETKTFHSLRPHVPLPSQTLPLSFPAFALSLLPSPLPSDPALIDATTDTSLSYPSLISQLHSLAFSLKTHLHLSKGDVAFILSPPRLDIPVLYLSLLSLGVIVSPANPISSHNELSRQISLVNPTVIFATSITASKLPTREIKTLLLDHPEFASFLITDNYEASAAEPFVEQTDVAAILFSSGTTGDVKAAAIPHRSFIAMAAGFHALSRPSAAKPDVMLLIAPMMHSLGFFFALKGFALGETTVVLTKPAGFGAILEAAERYKVTLMTASPPVVVAMARSQEVESYDLSALERVLCGGAPLPEEVAERFLARFPHVQLQVGYGSTEGGGISRMMDGEESKCLKSVGRLTENVEAKVVDVDSGEALSVGQHGELWVRGPALMTGMISYYYT